MWAAATPPTSCGLWQTMVEAVDHLGLMAGTDIVAFGGGAIWGCSPFGGGAQVKFRHKLFLI